jgi:hypothetical protein
MATAAGVSKHATGGCPRRGRAQAGAHMTSLPASPTLANAWLNFSVDASEKAVRAVRIPSGAIVKA